MRAGSGRSVSSVRICRARTAASMPSLLGSESLAVFPLTCPLSQLCSSNASSSHVRQGMQQTGLMHEMRTARAVRIWFDIQHCRSPHSAAARQLIDSAAASRAASPGHMAATAKNTNIMTLGSHRRSPPGRQLRGHPDCRAAPAVSAQRQGQCPSHPGHHLLRSLSAPARPSTAASKS